MKVMKLRAASGIIAGSLLAIGLVAQAQEKKDAAPATPVPAVPAVKPAPPAARPDIRASRVEMRLKGMAASLGLTDEQKEKVKPIIEEEITKMEQLQKEPRDRSAPPEERMKKIREIREASMAKMKPILTA